MKNHNRSKKTGKVGRFKRLRAVQLEWLEDRQLLHGGTVDHDHPHTATIDNLKDIVIGVGNLQRKDNQIDAQLIVNEAERVDDDATNDDLASAQKLNLGFDLGEYQAIDIRGELRDVFVTAQPNKEDAPIPANNPPPPEQRDDSSFDNANVASSSGITRFTGVIGDSPLGNNGQIPFALGGDGDYYELANIDAGQFLTANVEDNNGLTALVLFDEFGRVLQSSESNPAISNFISHQVHEDGTYYFGVFPFLDVSVFNLPADPTNPGGVYGGPQDQYEITISVDGSADIDFYSIDLMPGDILGVNGIGSADVLSLRNSNGDLLLQSSTDDSLFFPAESPLPGGGNTSLAYVISEPGTYYLGVQGNETYNNYLLETRVFRPAIESEPVGSEQILFLDFDGATFNSQVVFGPEFKAELSPLRDFMSSFGLSNEAELIDRVVAEVKADYDELKAFNPDMKLTILNSKDHADPFGQPNVSRVIVGGTQAELQIGGVLGIAESIDVGNFDRTETAVVVLELLSGPEQLGQVSLNHYPIAKGARKVDLVARGISMVVSHEAAHFFGAWHTDNLSKDNNIIDGGGGEFYESLGIGPDLIWGTADDTDPKFVDDIFDLREGFVGVEQVPGMFANILVSGKGDDATASKPRAAGNVYRDLDGDGKRDAGEGGFGGIRVYADMNGDGAFGISEPTATTASDGSFALQLASNVSGDVKIRVATQAGQVVTDPASGGISVAEILDGAELTFGVEALTGNNSGKDYGHAPLSYGTASHEILSGFHLGASVTGDDATGEDSNDDGVSLSGLVVGGVGTIEVDAQRASFPAGLVNGWIDFNHNGRFEANERVLANQRVDGEASFSVTVPSTAVAGQTWARFRMGYVRDVAPSGASTSGEVEDYSITIAAVGGGTGGGGGGGTGNSGPQANPDLVEVDAGSSNVVLNVLANDSAGDLPVTIQHVSGSPFGSFIQISSDGLRIIYTPAAGLTNTETFSYTIGNSIGTSTSTVTVDINSVVDPGGDLIAVRVQPTSNDGTPISSIAAGQSFLVNIIVDDLRPVATREGVFAAYLDVEFDANIADYNGDITFGEYFVNQQNPPDGDIDNLPGEADNDMGGFGLDKPIVTSNQLLMTIPMLAKSVGTFEITTNGPDNKPFREILLYPTGSAEANDDRIDFGSATLTITDVEPASAFTNRANRFDVDDDGYVVPRDALVLISNINDFGARQLNPTAGAVGGPYLDVTGDGWLSPRDARDLIAEINRLAAISAAGEPDDEGIAAAIDAALSDDDDDLGNALDMG